MEMEFDDDKLCPNHKMSHRIKILALSFLNHQKYSDKAIYLLLKKWNILLLFSVNAQSILTLPTTTPYTN